jgi:hypothetical protein
MKGNTMSGILERIEAKLDQLLAGTAAIQANTAAAVAPLAPTPAAAQPAVAGTGTGVAAYPPATQEMIVELVTPMVADPNVKALLQAEMHAMNIQALPEAQPHQYPELYWRFQQVKARLAAQPAAAQPAAAPASII